MENKLEISENKVLEYNEKAFKDTEQLFLGANKDDLDKMIKLSKENNDYKERINSLHFEKGRTIWLELKVEDSFLSGLLISWLYAKSKYDSGNLHALGCELRSIMYSKPSGYTPEEIAAITLLYNKAVGINE